MFTDFVCFQFYFQDYVAQPCSEIGTAYAETHIRRLRSCPFYNIGQIKAGFKISADPSVRNRQKCYQVEKIKILPVCFS